jgi:hypothetical protein
MSKAVCVACRHTIDAAARLCPYCGANPQTGEKVDTQAILAEVFRPREVTTSESVLEYARHRQGAVIAIGIAVAFLTLAALHQFVTSWTAKGLTSGPAVPLTEITDLSNQAPETPVPMPELNFQYEGQPQKLRTYIVEPGWITPAEVAGAQPGAAPNGSPQNGLPPSPAAAAATPPPAPPATTPR